MQRYFRVLAVMLSLVIGGGCTAKVFGVPESQWARMSSDEQRVVRDAWLERERLREERYLVDAKKREHDRKLALLQAEQNPPATQPAQHPTPPRTAVAPAPRTLIVPATSGPKMASAEKKNVPATKGPKIASAEKKNVPATRGPKMAAAEKKNVPATKGPKMASAEKKNVPATKGTKTAAAEKKNVPATRGPKTVVAEKKNVPVTRGPKTAVAEKKNVSATPGPKAPAAEKKDIPAAAGPKITGAGKDMPATAGPKAGNAAKDKDKAPLAVAQAGVAGGASPAQSQVAPTSIIVEISGGTAMVNGKRRPLESARFAIRENESRTERVAVKNGKELVEAALGVQYRNGILWLDMPSDSDQTKALRADFVSAWLSGGERYTQDSNGPLALRGARFTVKVSSD